MFYAKQYLLAQSLEEAYQANQKRSAAVVGGMCWMKMGRRQLQTVIDLSALGLDEITPTASGFAIGAMVTLRRLETHPGLEKAFGGAFAQAVRPIVGVQFRSCATVGGSVWGRFGFSDVLTFLLSLDTYVELYRGGLLPLEEFASLKKDNDILVRIHIRKNPGAFVYQAMRNQRTDFPVLTCALSRMEDGYRTVIGARPGRALVLRDETNLLAGGITEENAEAFASWAAERIPVGSNLRGSAAYRTHLVRVLVKRGLLELGGKETWN